MGKFMRQINYFTDVEDAILSARWMKMDASDEDDEKIDEDDQGIDEV